MLLESVLFCFHFSLKTITGEVFYFPPSGWVGKLEACFYPSVNSFLLLHPSGYPDHCVHMTGDAIWQALPSSFTLFLFQFCSISKGQLYGAGKHSGSLAVHFKICLHSLPEGQTNPTGFSPTQTRLLRKQQMAQDMGKKYHTEMREEGISVE